LIALHLFFAAIEIARRPLALNSLFGFVITGCVGSEPCLNSLYLARCAAAIFRRVAALNFFRGLPVGVEVADSVRPLPSNMLRSSAI